MKKKYTLLSLFIPFIFFAQITEVSDAAWGNIYVNGKFIFAKNDPVHGTEIWASDGTAAGTNILFDIVTGTGSSNPNYLTVIDNVVYFQTTATNEIWRTDGTPGGTYTMVSSGLNDPRDFKKIGSFILFRSGNNNNRKLWKMQDTPNSHVQLSLASMIDVSAITNLNSSNGLFNVRFSSGWEIWRTNGNTMQFVADIDSGNSNFQQLNENVVFNSELYFTGYSTDKGTELWKTDGTTPGTVLVADIQSNSLGNIACANCSTPSDFKVVGNTLFFEAGNQTYGSGRRLYKLVGSDPFIVKNINPSGAPQIRNTTSFNGKLYFYATDGLGFKLWESDGTENGTQPIVILQNDESLLLSGSENTDITFYNNYIIYNKLTSTYGYEVWAYNLNSRLNSLVMDYNTGTPSFFTFDYFEFNDEIYFAGQLENQSAIKMYKFGQNALSSTSFDSFSKLLVYPNPTSGLVNINVENISDYDFQLYSYLGQKLQIYLHNGMLDLSSFSTGVYQLNIIHKKSNQQTKQKIIKQ